MVVLHICLSYCIKVPIGIGKREKYLIRGKKGEKEKIINKKCERQFLETTRSGTTFFGNTRTGLLIFVEKVKLLND